MLAINVGLDHQRQPRLTLLAVRRDRHQVAALDLSASLHGSPFPSTIPTRVLPWDLGQPAATGAALPPRSRCSAYPAPTSWMGRNPALRSAARCLFTLTGGGHQSLPVLHYP